MSTALEIYKNSKETIRKLIMFKSKVFICEENSYWENNIDRLSATIVASKFRPPFEDSVFFTQSYFISIGINDMGVINYIINIKSPRTDCIIVGKLEIEVTVDDTAYLPSTCTRLDKMALILTKATRVEHNGIRSLIKIVATISVVEANGTVLPSEFIAQRKIDGKLVLNIVNDYLPNAIAYFYELIGEDFEVKIIDQPKMRDKKGGKKRKLQGPPLFTIVRRPRTTITVDVTPVTQECPKSDEPVVHRGPLEYGHYRRPHTRTFRHPRYVNVLGKTIEVRGTRVGPEKERETVYLVAKSKGDAI